MNDFSHEKMRKENRRREEVYEESDAYPLMVEKTTPWRPWYLLGIVSVGMKRTKHTRGNERGVIPLSLIIINIRERERERNCRAAFSETSF